MPLVSLQTVLEFAERKKIAIPAFNIDDLVAPVAMLEAAEQEEIPLILTIGQGAIRSGNLVFLADTVRQLALRSTVPVVLHLDHSRSLKQIAQAIHLGFTSVMFDGSFDSLQENMETSMRVCEWAHDLGVSVECELGAIGGTEDGVQGQEQQVQLQEVEIFVKQVPCDALAIGIGNVHGMYQGTPHLNLERITECVQLGTPPLVLHGGSGIPEPMIQEAIQRGIRKINVATEFRNAYLQVCRDCSGWTDYYAVQAELKTRYKQLAQNKMCQFQMKGQV